MTITQSHPLPIFEVSVCVLLGGLELLACLAGKLVRENSTAHFDYFYNFCGGILLAKGIFCGLFDSFGVSTDYSIGRSLALFSFSFVLLTAINIALKNSTINAYQKVVSLNEVDDEDALGIELGDLSATADDEEDEDSEGPSSHHKSSQGEYVRMFWSSCVVAITIVAEGANGLLMGYEKHTAYVEYSKVFLQGLLLCLACGAVLEDTVHQASEFLRALLLLIFAFPLGMFVGNYVVNFFGFTADQVLQYSATVNPIAAGCYTAVAMIYILPSDHGDKSSIKHDLPPRGDSIWSVLSSPSKVKAICFILGYLITSSSVRLI
ncbi:hypothetical protein EON65_01260 [archaeon]|nr:MAG: hypothetical protein EON65_01260 [archaeon]